MDLDLVPPTTSDTTGGVYQLAIEDAKHLDWSDSADLDALIETNNYSQLQGFDYLTQQTDRHLMNYFLLDDSSIVLIDNERSFIRNSVPLPDRSMADFFTDSEWESFLSKGDDFWASWLNDLPVYKYNDSHIYFIQRIKNFKNKITQDRINAGKFPSIETAQEEVLNDMVREDFAESSTNNCQGCRCTMM